LLYKPFLGVALSAALGACAFGGDDDGNPMPDAPVPVPGASFSIGGSVRTFTPDQCSLGAGSTFYQLMCALPGGTPQVNMVLQAPPPVGTYDQTTPDTILSIVDPAVGAQILAQTLSIHVTETATSGQGSWKGYFEATASGNGVTGMFDVVVP
jgi:hypothetical protein